MIEVDVEDGELEGRVWENNLDGHDVEVFNMYLFPCVRRDCLTYQHDRSGFLLLLVSCAWRVDYVLFAVAVGVSE